MTIETEPLNISSVNGNLIWVVYDTDYTNLNYKYVADVYVNAVFVFRSLSFPNPTNNRGIFDLSDVIRQYTNSAFNDEQGEGKFKTSIEVKFGEQFGGVIYTNQISSTRTFVNNYLKRGEANNIMVSFNDLPATDRPKELSIVEGTATYYVPYYFVTGATFNTTINGVTTTVTPAVAQTMQRINIADPAATADYDAVINGVTYRVKVVCAGFYKNYTLHFLNKWGGWESMLFNKVSRKTISSEKKNYQQLPYRVDGAGAVTYKVGNIMNEQGTTFGVIYEEKLKISTDLLTDAEYQWLYQLVLSPFIYLEDAGTFYPVIIDTTNYEFKEHVVDMLTNLKIDISFGVKQQTQFR